MLHDKRELRKTVCRPGSTALTTRASGRRHGYSPRKRSPARGVYQVKCCEAYAGCICQQCEYSNWFCFFLSLAAALAATHVQPATGTPLLLHVCSCCSLCMLLHGVIFFVYCHLQLLCQLNAKCN